MCANPEFFYAMERRLWELQQQLTSAEATLREIAEADDVSAGLAFTARKYFKEKSEAEKKGESK